MHFKIVRVLADTWHCRCCWSGGNVFPFLPERICMIPVYQNSMSVMLMAEKVSGKVSKQ